MAELGDRREQPAGAGFRSAQDPGTGDHRHYSGARLPLHRALKSSEPQTFPPSPADQILERPAVAILPFRNMSGDAAQDYFADGITEDLIATDKTAAPAPLAAGRSDRPNAKDDMDPQSMQLTGTDPRVAVVIEFATGS